MAAYLSAFTVNGGVPLFTRKFGSLKAVKKIHHGLRGPQ